MINKSDLFEKIRDFYLFIKTQWNCQIKILHSDREPALGNQYYEWAEDEGLEIEQTAAYTPEQNGPIERAGGVIVSRARALRLDSKLPSDLWPEAAKTAVYLLNRSPTKQLGWITPIEKLKQLFEAKKIAIAEADYERAQKIKIAIERLKGINIS